MQQIKAPFYVAVEVGTAAIPVVSDMARSYNYFRIQVRHTNADGSNNTAGNLLYGDSRQQIFELTKGEFSPWWPCERTDDLYVRVLSGNCTVAAVFSDVAA